MIFFVNVFKGTFDSDMIMNALSSLACYTTQQLALLIVVLHYV